MFSFGRLNPGRASYKTEQTPASIFLTIPFSISVRKIFVCFFVSDTKSGLGSYPGMLRVYSWLCTPGSLLVVPRGPYLVPGIKPRSAGFQVSTLPTVLSPGPDLEDSY